MSCLREFFKQVHDNEKNTLFEFRSPVHSYVNIIIIIIIIIAITLKINSIKL